MKPTTLLRLFLQDRERRGCVPGTLRNYREQITSLIHSLERQRVRRAESIRTRHIQNWITEMRTSNLSAVTIRKRTLVARSFFYFAKKRRLIARDPIRNMPIPRAPRRIPKAITETEVNRLLNQKRWSDDPHRERDFVMLSLMLDSGLRREEIRLLDCEDVDLTRGLVHVWHGKGDKERWSVFLQDTARALRKYLNHREHGPLFTDGTGRRLSRVAIYRVVKKRGKQTDVNVSPHRLRHTFITEYLNQGGNVVDARDLAGHDDIKTTLDYKAVAVLPLARKHMLYSPLRHLAKKR